MFWYLIIATIPGALFGYFIDNLIEDKVRLFIWLIAILLAVMGIFIFLGDKWAQKHYKFETDYKHITFLQVLVIGLSQALAVIPGFSRSGTTILAARLMGLSREASTKFTFMMSMPIILGATMLKIPKLSFSIDVFVGIFVSFIVGLIVIKFFLEYIKEHDFSIFVVYRIIFAIIILIKYFIF